MKNHGLPHRPAYNLRTTIPEHTTGPCQPLAFMTMRSCDILSQRAYRGKRIQSEGTNHQLTGTKTGGIRTGFTVCMSSGLGFQAVMEPQGVTEVLSQGTFSACRSLCNTHSWGDLVTPSIYPLMIQRRGVPVEDEPGILASSFRSTVSSLNSSTMRCNFGRVPDRLHGCRRTLAKYFL